MAIRQTLTVRSSLVDVEFYYCRQIEDWRVGSWWTDNERITHRDVELASDDVIADHAGEWDIIERRA